MRLTREKAREYGKKSSRKGIKNKVDSEIRACFEKLVSDKLPELSEWLNRIAEENPEKAMVIILKMSEYILPKLQRVNVTTDMKPKMEAVIDVSKLSTSTLLELKEAYHNSKTQD